MVAPVDNSGPIDKGLLNSLTGLQNVGPTYAQSITKRRKAIARTKAGKAGHAKEHESIDTLGFGLGVFLGIAAIR